MITKVSFMYDDSSSWECRISFYQSSKEVCTLYIKDFSELSIGFSDIRKEHQVIFYKDGSLFFLVVSKSVCDAVNAELSK